MQQSFTVCERRHRCLWSRLPLKLASSWHAFLVFSFNVSPFYPGPLNPMGLVCCYRISLRLLLFRQRNHTFQSGLCLAMRIVDYRECDS